MMNYFNNLRPMTLVFVHLGTSPPEILFANIRWLRHSFPNVQIRLASDLPFNLFKEICESEFIELTDTGFWSRINSSPYSLDFRGGYWLHTIRRLAALADIHNHLGSGAILHIESDMLLLPNFPFGAFSDVENLAWIRWTSNSDMPGLLFSPNPSETLKFSRELVALLEFDGNFIDGTALRYLVNDNRVSVDYLPEGSLDCFSSGEICRFGDYIFDALSFGVYLAGTDPRNSWGISKRHLKYPDSSCVDPRRFNISYVGNDLVARHRGQSRQMKLANLHIHSKDIRFFNPELQSRVLTEAVASASSLKRGKVFRLYGFIGALTQLAAAIYAKLQKIRPAARL